MMREGALYRGVEKFSSETTLNVKQKQKTSLQRFECSVFSLQGNGKDYEVFVGLITMHARVSSYPETGNITC